MNVGAKNQWVIFYYNVLNNEDEREKMRKKIFDFCGIANFDENMLLDAKQNDQFKEWRNTILAQLENFVVETRRFATRKSC